MNGDMKPKERLGLYLECTWAILPVPGMITKVTFLNEKIKSIMKDPRVTVLIHDDSIIPYHRNPQS